MDSTLLLKEELFSCTVIPIEQEQIVLEINNGVDSANQMGSDEDDSTKSDQNWPQCPPVLEENTKVDFAREQEARALLEEHHDNNNSANSFHSLEHELVSLIGAFTIHSPTRQCDTGSVPPIHHRVDILRPISACSSPSSLSPVRSFRPTPTKHVRKVDSLTLQSGYVKLNQYNLTMQIGQWGEIGSGLVDSENGRQLVIDRYRIIKNANGSAQGSYGIVKLAYNEEDNNHYAMKILDKKKLMKKFAMFRKPPTRRSNGGTMTAPDPLAQVYREIAILKKLNHPNVVKLVEVLDDPSDDYLYMVFEFVERGCVMDIPTCEPLDEQTAWRYFRDTLMGLEYLHYQKIVHRDLKPSNLLVSETGQIKIADFGVSSEFEGVDAFLTGTAGTPAFMAPEALQEGSNQFYSGRAQDVWSLGITLFAFIFGRVPFSDSYVIALHKKIKTEPLVFPEKPYISPELRHLIENMLNKDPVSRLTLHLIREHAWVTKSCQEPVPTKEDNCQNLITVTEEDIRNSVRVIPSLGTLILIKSMGQRKRFGNPYRMLNGATSNGLSGSQGHLHVSNRLDHIKSHDTAVRCSSANLTLVTNLQYGQRYTNGSATPQEERSCLRTVIDDGRRGSEDNVTIITRL